MDTRSQKVATDIQNLLRARNPLIWIVTREEARTERYVFEAAASAAYLSRFWDCDQGISELDGSRSPATNDSMSDIGTALDWIKRQGQTPATKERPNRNVWVLRDVAVWLQGPIGIQTVRKLRNLVRLLPGLPTMQAQAIVVLAASGDVPPELSAHATVIEWPLPDRAEAAAILDTALSVVKAELREQATPKGADREAAIDAVLGLTGEEAKACYAKSLVQFKAIRPLEVAREKKRLVTKERVLEWYDPLPGGLEAVGGLDQLKSWLVARATAYSPEAKAYGLPSPKGAVIVGVSGTGKSLTAKAVATAWGVPLIKLDLGALKSKFVGESEANLRKAIRVIEAIGRCVVWIDEVEKALSGATQGAADGGVSADALGAILTWMQERQGESFVIATANDVSQLPPELLRKGRFDEVWWVDLPTHDERKAILAAALKAHGRDLLAIDYGLIASKTEKFTGAEIASVVPEALFKAFADDGREITTDDLLDAAGNIVPLAETASEKIATLRQWAKGRARPASNPEAKVTVDGGGVLDI